jgi:hypothetical protein
VRLLRAEQGKAFVDLLNEKANDSGENEMGYVERTLGFSTRHLDDRDIRLVILHTAHIEMLALFMTFNLLRTNSVGLLLRNVLV